MPTKISAELQIKSKFYMEMHKALDFQGILKIISYGEKNREPINGSTLKTWHLTNINLRQKSKKTKI